MREWGDHCKVGCDERVFVLFSYSGDDVRRNAGYPKCGSVHIDSAHSCETKCERACEVYKPVCVLVHAEVRMEKGLETYSAASVACVTDVPHM